MRFCLLRYNRLKTDRLESVATQEQLIVNDVSGHQRIINQTRSIVSRRLTGLDTYVFVILSIANI